MNSRKRITLLSIAMAVCLSLVSFLLCSCSHDVPTIEISADGYWVIDGEKTEYKAVSEDGVSPTIEISEDGYWVINGILTTIKAKGEDGESVKSNAPDSVQYIHLSFDDVSLSLQNLTSERYVSLFDEPFFAWLFDLHNTYGAKFSLYCFTSDLKNVPSRYAEEFFAAREWLKLGLHADDSGSSFASHDYDAGVKSWNDFVDEVTRVTGSYLSVDRIPRLHTFAGSEDALRGMRSANYGALGFLSADDSRLPYYLDGQTAEYLYSHDHITDYQNGLTFIATDIRADWFINGFTSPNIYRAPMYDNLYDELNYRSSAPAYANSSASVIVFIHEWQIYNGIAMDTSRTVYIEDACRFAAEHEIRFSYPQHETFFPTPCDLH